MDSLRQRLPSIALRTACRALDIPRASADRRLRPKPCPGAHPHNPRRLENAERQRILDLLHAERFADQPPRKLYADLLEKGNYVASVRTMYRLLAESRARRNQRAPRHFPVPSLAATGPNLVCAWDGSKLPKLEACVFLNLPVILDLRSRYVIAWMIA